MKRVENRVITVALGASGIEQETFHYITKDRVKIAVTLVSCKKRQGVADEIQRSIIIKKFRHSDFTTDKIEKFRTNKIS